MPNFEDILKSLRKSEFRSKFKLKSKELNYLNRNGFPLIMKHGREFIVERLAPAFPKNDGKQTPWENHPIFVAQHATATCCRGCLFKWHKIPKGKELNDQEVEYVLGIIEYWLEDKTANS